MSFDKIHSVLNQARLAIQSHGGDVEFVDYKDDIVYIRLTGACIGCPMSLFTIKLGLESQLKEVIPTLVKVVSLEN